MNDDVGRATRRFLDAIVWGEHLVVWEMLSPTGREHVLAAGERRGMDPMQAQRLRLGTSPPQERDSFLAGLVHGLRVDFSHVAIDEVHPAENIVVRADGAIEVPLECPAAFGEASWAAGTLVVSGHNGAWLVDRVHPLVSGEQ